MIAFFSLSDHLTLLPVKKDTRERVCRMRLIGRPGEHMAHYSPVLQQDATTKWLPMNLGHCPAAVSLFAISATTASALAAICSGVWSWMGCST